MSNHYKVHHYLCFTAPTIDILKQVRELLWDGKKFTFSHLLPLKKGDDPVEIWGSRYDISKSDCLKLRKTFKIDGEEINIQLGSFDGGLDPLFVKLSEVLKGIVITDVRVQSAAMVPVEVYKFTHGETKHVKDYKNHYSYIISGLEKTPEETMEYCYKRGIVVDGQDVKMAANAIVYETSMKHVIEDEKEKAKLEKDLVKLGQKLIEK